MTAEASYFKSTLNLPQTDFPMKGNLPVKEPKIIANWESVGAYQRMVGKKQGSNQICDARWSYLCQRRYSYWSCIK